MSDRQQTEKAARRDGPAARGATNWTVPGAIDQDEARKGTAASDPVLVLTADGDAAAAAVRDERSPAEIEAEIDRTREHLSATLDELSERLSPRNIARAGGRGLKAQFVDPDSGAMRTRRVATVAGGVGAAVAALLALRGLRRRS
jgi:uncharacterized protein DUF3618